jgi:hypothetical protein
MHFVWPEVEIDVAKISKKRVPARTAARCLGNARLLRGARSLILLLILASGLAMAFGQVKDPKGGVVEGIVFAGDSENPSPLTGVKVVLSGPMTAETATDNDGKYLFQRVPAGSYKLEASFSGMTASETISVAPNQSLSLPLRLVPPEVKTSVTVAATEDTSVPTISAPETITPKIVQDAPNVNDKFESLLPLVPGVVRGPDGLINMKGARNTQSGALVNSANVTDPATGSPAISLPLDVVSTVQVVSNPYDPEYGKLTGAVSLVETKTGDFDKYHFSIQNILPRPRERGGSVVGLGAATPRFTVTGPLIKDRAAFTQSFEYRYVRTPVNSLPPMQRDTKLESVNTYNQLDLTLSSKQTATISFTLYPQKLGCLGLNTFTPQPSTGDFHQRGYQLYAQDRYALSANSLLTSQFSYKKYDADVTTHDDGEPFELLVDTTEGSFFNRQARRTERVDWQESYQLLSRHLAGTHQLKLGLDYSYSHYKGRETFLPVEIIGTTNVPIESLTFGAPTAFETSQNEVAWFALDQWAPSERITLDLGVRFDSDTVTGSTHAAPRAGALIALTKDGKTMLKGGAGLFYDRVPLLFPMFGNLPGRTVSMLDSTGALLSSETYQNRVEGRLQNPRSSSWDVALERRVLQNFTVRVGYEQRNTARNFIVTPTADAIALENRGSDSYREFQVSGRYRLPRATIDASYVRSRAYGNLNDPLLFFGNYPQAVIQPDDRGRLSFDAPNRVLLKAEIDAPGKILLIPVWDIHTGFPYSVENEYREYVGPRNVDRYPRFSSFDLQGTRPFTLHVHGKHIHVRAGGGIYNLFDHFNPRDVQNINASVNFRTFYNDNWRLYRGKFVFQF